MEAPEWHIMGVEEGSGWIEAPEIEPKGATWNRITRENVPQECCFIGGGRGMEAPEIKPQGETCKIDKCSSD